MIAVIQRVSSASVEVEKQLCASIGHGLLIFVGIEEADGDDDIEWLAGKIVGLRIFNDSEDVMNVSIKDCDGEVIVVSQFTLQASTKKGNRPSYIKAAKPDTAIPIYEKFKLEISKQLGKVVQSGVFGADMKVSLLNDGPVTIIIDTKNKV
jgi:D-tyrosyl-tRNA(Tyr) deacylase